MVKIFLAKVAFISPIAKDNYPENPQDTFQSNAQCVKTFEICLNYMSLLNTGTGEMLVDAIVKTVQKQGTEDEGAYYSYVTEERTVNAT